MCHNFGADQPDIVPVSGINASSGMTVMKFLKNWLRRVSQQNSTAGAALQGDQASLNDCGDEASSGWLGEDSVDSSIFDSNPQSANKPDDDDLQPHQEPASNGDLLSSAEKLMGYDPYDTGRFYKKRA